MKYRAKKRSDIRGHFKQRDIPDLTSVNRSEERKLKSDRYKVGRLKTAAYAIASISTFFIVASFVLKAIGLSDIGWNWELLFLVVDSVAVVCLLQGLWQEKAALLQPFVVLNIITISFLILLTLFFATAVLNAHSYAGEYVEMALSGRLQQIAEVLSVQQRNGKMLFQQLQFEYFCALSA
ncbi:unnamed protein product [Anisakis simplex]|uniref:Transmembrane protein n=1 Tax=Anisakis simplex TaxID=6269 RepID=A0A0M3J1F9_ANISI|nr:unnamed protein product [Anisakis simplex]